MKIDGPGFIDHRFGANRRSPYHGVVPLVIFDLDNTLLDRDAVFRRWAVEWVADRGLAPVEVDWMVAADGHGYSPRLGFAEAMRERYRLASPATEVLDQYRRRLVELIEPDPRVLDALGRLRAAGWRIAVATNGPAGQRLKIESFGLLDTVDAVVVSDEFGVAKPDPRIFAEAARRCGVRLTGTGEHWMVGDCPLRDVAGGRGSGLRTAWVRRGRTWDGAEPPDVVIDHVAEMVAVLAGGSVTAPGGTGGGRMAGCDTPGVPGGETARA